MSASTRPCWDGWVVLKILYHVGQYEALVGWVGVLKILYHVGQYEALLGWVGSP